MARRIPYVPQLEVTDCGAACLAMTLAYHGRPVALRDVRDAAGTDRNGVDALALVDAARWYGLRARGVKVEPEQLSLLPTGSILHWEFSHFVVFESTHRGGVDIVDPASGRRRVPDEKFGKAYTGVAIELEPGDDFHKGTVNKASAWRYLQSLLGQRGLLTRVVVMSLLLRLFGLALPVLTGALVDRVVPAGNRHLLTVLAAGLAAVVGYYLVAALLRAHLLVVLRTNFEVRTMLDFINHLVDLPYRFFLTRPSGDLLARLNSHETVRAILTTGTISAVLDGLMVSVYLIVLFVMSVPIALLALALAVVQITVLLVARRRNQLLTAEDLQASAKAQSNLVEMLAGIETLKAAGAETRAVEHWSNLFAEEVRISVAKGRLDAWVEAAMGTLQLASPLVVLAYGGTLVLDGRMSLGTVLAVSAIATGFLFPLANLLGAALQLQLLGGYMERINDVLDTPVEQAGTTTRLAGRLAGEISASNVTFAYGPTAPPALVDVDLAIAPGQKVALVGRSGAGKSTLAHLLLGLYRPDAGVVRYDGHDLAELDARSVRRQIGIVTQRAYLFGTTVRDNILLTAPALGLDDVERAARLACINEDIAAMPMGYDTLLLDGGASLSGGQRQRVALARALVHRPRILLLDEATSALDAVTEREVYANLATLDCTAIIVAHRLSTIAQADLIVVLEHGRVVERGNHATLTALGGRYAELVSGQEPTDASSS